MKGLSDNLFFSSKNLLVTKIQVISRVGNAPVRKYTRYLSGKHSGGVQMCESGSWRRICQVVSRHVDGLHRDNADGESARTAATAW